MAVLYSNNASTTLSASITSAATTLVVASGKGALFPAISGSDYFYITLVNAAGVIEIMKVTSRSTDTFTVVRGQDGTSAVAWAAGDRVELRITKAMLDDFKTDAKQGVVGDPVTMSLTFGGADIPFVFGGSSGATGSFLKKGVLGAYWDSTSYLPLSGGTMTGAVSFLGTVYNNVGGARLFAGSGGSTYLYTNTSGMLWRNQADTATVASLSDAGAFNAVGAITQNGNQVLHAGNYTSYSPSLTGSGASGTWSININGAAYALRVTDSRSTATTPQTIDMGVMFDFKANGTDGLSDGGGYFGEMTFRQYGSGTDWTGGLSHQLGFTDNGNIWQRSGSGTTWGSWKKILDSSNYTSYAASVVHTHAYLPLAGGMMTGSIGHNRGVHNYFERSANVNVGGMGWHTDDVFYVAGHPSYGPAAGNLVRIYGFGSDLAFGNSTVGDSFYVNGTTGTVYFNKSESINLYGVRGRFTNEYIHLYNKVGVGNPSGWGVGEGSTPNQGLSTYGGINVAYGTNADSTFNGRINIPASSQAINTTTPGTGLYQLNFTGQGTPDYAQAITWGWSTSGAQAGIYVQSSGAYGTKMYLATTDSFATGAKVAVSIDHSGNVNVARGALTQGGNQVLHAGNYTDYVPAMSRIVYGNANNASNGLSATQNVYELGQYKSGFWDIYGAAWMPDTGWWWGGTFAHTSNNGAYNYSGQIAFQNSGGGNNVYLRTISNGSPTSWSRILTSGNYTSYGDGRYVLKSGDTMSGQLDFSNGGVRRTISKAIGYRGVWDGTLNGYLIFAKAYVSGTQDGSEVSGRIFLSRGSSYSGKRTETFEVFSKSAYNSENFVINWIGGRDFSAGTLHKVTYNGTVYHALRLGQTGGGPDQSFLFDGFTSNAGLMVVLDSEVSNVTSYGNVGLFVGLDGVLSSGSNAILHAGNYSSYALPLGGGTLTGNRPIQLETNGGSIFIKGDTGGWGMGLYFKGSDDVVKGSFGALGGGSSFSYLWAGVAYNNTWMTWASTGSNSNVDHQMNGNYLRFDQSGTRSWNIRATGGNLDIASGDGLGSLRYNGGVILNSNNYTSYVAGLGGGNYTGTIQVTQSGVVDAFKATNSSTTLTDESSIRFQKTMTPTGTVTTNYVGGIKWEAKNSNGAAYDMVRIFGTNITSSSLDSGNYAIGELNLVTYKYIGAYAETSKLRLSGGSMYWHSGGGNAKLQFTSGAMYGSDGAYDIGASSYRMATVYTYNLTFADGTTQTTAAGAPATISAIGSVILAWADTASTIFQGGTIAGSSLYSANTSSTLAGGGSLIAMVGTAQANGSFWAWTPFNASQWVSGRTSSGNTGYQAPPAGSGYSTYSGTWRLLSPAVPARSSGYDGYSQITTSNMRMGLWVRIS